MKKILMLGTGGTIASEITPEGLSPELTPAQLLRFVPGVSEIAEVDCLSLFNIDSTNITPRHWSAIAHALRENYARYDGFVISHGTDTMAYTAAALSYLVQGAKKPIILTGAQKPINYDSTDSKMNLTDAFVCACSDKLHGVCIVFSGRVILGTRARKTCSKSYTAFSSINYPDLGILHDHRLLTYIEPEWRPEPLFHEGLDRRVGLMKMIPGADVEQLEFLLQRKDALILECFGVGGLPSYEDDRLFDAVRRHTAAGRFLVMTTQVQNEGSDLSVYQVGHRLKGEPRVLEAYDMTTEAALAKMMWILDRTREAEEVGRLFYTPVAHDILTPVRGNGQ
ncbi:MAG: asparaginase [Oscillospiraceae bacterium]|nr:asparaginase [Oscillospiraceae bacterium]